MKRWSLVGVALATTGWVASEAQGQLAGALATGQEVADARAGTDAEAGEAVRSVARSYQEAFDAGDAEAVAALFLPEAEVGDEAGNLYRGRDEIRALHADLFERFPGVTLTMTSRAARLVGPDLVVDDGFAVHAAAGAEARSRYTSVLARRDGRWQVASVREFAAESPADPRRHLEPLATIVGDWVAEHPGAVTRVSARWAEGEPFLLIDFETRVADRPALRSTQRVGWDPLTGQVKSWVFDSDGGYGEGLWTTDGDGWLIKSSSVLPDGLTGSATFRLTPEGEDRIVWTIADRVRAGHLEPGDVVTLVRQAPRPK